MIRTVTHSDNVRVRFAVCDECKAEHGPLTEGVQHTESALNVAMPHGWLHTREPGCRTVSDYCPACAVAPEHRRR